MTVCKLFLFCVACCSQSSRVQKLTRQLSSDSVLKQPPGGARADTKKFCAVALRFGTKRGSCLSSGTCLHGSGRGLTPKTRHPPALPSTCPRETGAPGGGRLCVQVGKVRNLTSRQCTCTDTPTEELAGAAQGDRCLFRLRGVPGPCAGTHCLWCLLP